MIYITIHTYHQIPMGIRPIRIIKKKLTTIYFIFPIKAVGVYAVAQIEQGDTLSIATFELVFGATS